MSRYEIIERLKVYFSIKELVGKKTFTKHGNRSWKFLDTNTLHCLLIVREGINKPIVVNTWHKEGSFGQRGLRTTIQQILINVFRRGRLYLSAHIFGKAFDFHVIGMSSQEVRYWIIDNEHLFPCKVRLENLKNGVPINWVHLDTFDEEHNPKIYLFNV